MRVIEYSLPISIFSNISKFFCISLLCFDKSKSLILSKKSRISFNELTLFVLFCTFCVVCCGVGLTAVLLTFELFCDTKVFNIAERVLFIGSVIFVNCVFNCVHNLFIVSSVKFPTNAIF